ncbi:MAG: FAD-dependent oxidoreductase [Candidatus Nanopelagicales bacterium]
MTNIAIVGLGALGSAAAWEATRRGYSVIGLEQFELGHERGASHDTSRILRHSYHTPHYVELTFRAYDAWAELESDSGIALITQTGGVDLFPPGAAIDMSTYTQSMDAIGIGYEVMDNAALRERWPQFVPPEGTVSLYQERSSIGPAARGTATMQRLARERGADLRERTRVESIEPMATGVRLITSDGVVTADRCIITADAWTSALTTPLGWPIPLTVTEEQVTYVNVPASYADLPLWIWMDDPSFYGFPTYTMPGQAPEMTMKAAEDCGGPTVTGDERSGELDPAMLDRLMTFLRSTFTDIGEVVRSKRCLYSLTADRDFVISTVPGYDNVIVGLGAAHAFKFAPAFGGMLLDLVDGHPVDPVFQLDRPGITDPAYEANWLV